MNQASGWRPDRTTALIFPEYAAGLVGRDQWSFWWD